VVRGATHLARLAKRDAGAVAGPPGVRRPAARRYSGRKHAAGSFLWPWPQERSLWEQAIARDAGAAAELFDREGMALAAMEAASLQPPGASRCPRLHGAEYLAFQRWRETSRPPAAPAAGAAWTTILAWRIACVERGIGGLPARLGLAGFVLPDPMVSRLLAGAGRARRRTVPASISVRQ
jgi:hypothetical protein